MLNRIRWTEEFSSVKQQIDHYHNYNMKTLTYILHTTWAAKLTTCLQRTAIDPLLGATIETIEKTVIKIMKCQVCQGKINTGELQACSDGQVEHVIRCVPQLLTKQINVRRVLMETKQTCFPHAAPSNYWELNKNNTDLFILSRHR